MHLFNQAKCINSIDKEKHLLYRIEVLWWLMWQFELMYDQNKKNNMKRHWGSLVRYVITFCVQLFYIFVHCPWAFSYSLNDLALLTIAIYNLLILTDFKSTIQFHKGTVSDRWHAKHEIFVLKKILSWRTGSVWLIELESLL